MSDMKRGMVVPFAFSAGKLRRSASHYRRRGQPLESVLLLRRAAEKDDATVGWFDLAEVMRQMGCHEQAAVLLSRVLAREDHPCAAWLEMARCQMALGQKELAADCLYHQLQEDPWSPESDAARLLLAEAEAGVEHREAHRLPLLLRRGMSLMMTEQRALGVRRVERAVRLSGEPERILTTLALMSMLEWDHQQAMKYLARALKKAPGDPRVLTSMATLLSQRNQRRMAVAFLAKAGPMCDDPVSEDQFLTAAWALDAWKTTEAYLKRRMQKHPHRIPLLHARATMLFEQDDREGAANLWRLILSIDPTDRRAMTLLAWMQEHPEEGVPAPGKLPRSAMAAQQQELRDSVAKEDFFRHGSRSRMLLDWCAASPDEGEQAIAMEVLDCFAGAPEAMRYMRELLVRPCLHPEVRRHALYALAEKGCHEPMPMLVGARYTEVQCRPVTASAASKRPWRRFLPLLLTETRRYQQSESIVDFAATLWSCMTESQREDAGGNGAYLWCKAMEVLYLRMCGMEEAAARVVRQMPVSPRKLSRKLRRLGNQMEQMPDVSGEGEIQ